MRSILVRTSAVALLIPIVAGCAGKPLVPAPGAERYEAELTRAASVITPEAVLKNLGVIADDSMGGRNTPSPGLEKTAEYLASRYREWGLLPAGENGTYFQRYPLVTRGIDQSQAYVEVNINGVPTRFMMGNDGYVTGGGVLSPKSGQLVLLAGVLTPDAIAAAGLKGQIAVAVYDTARGRDWRNWERAIRAEDPIAIVYIDNRSEELFNRVAGMIGNATRRTLEEGDGSGMPVFHLREGALAKMASYADQPDYDMMRRSPGPVVQPVPEAATISVYAPIKTTDRVTVPNVVAMIPGSDPLLKDQYVVYSAHMDHIGTIGDGVGGCRPAPAKDGEPVDSICNGADDDGSGTTGVLLIAKAYSQLKVKPRRTMVFLNVSGEEKGLLGSSWFSNHPTVPMDKIVANINNDMIGRNNPDSIVVIGKEHSNMGETLARVNARHPELNMTTADDIWPEERFYFRSDHYNFARKGVPILFFFNGVHPQYHRSDDEIGLIETGKLARVAKMGFYLGAEIANTTQKPQWDPESYKEIVEGAGR